MPIDPNAPCLEQTVRWGEQYVSSALNRKVAGVLNPGIYHGFVVTPGVGLQVRVDNDPDDYPYSVAVVERDVWSITVTMTDGGTVDNADRFGRRIPCARRVYKRYDRRLERALPCYERP